MPPILLLALVLIAQAGSESPKIAPIVAWSPDKVCSLLSLPGDFVVNSAYWIGQPNTRSGKILYHTVDILGLGGAILDFITGLPPEQKFSHSAIIDEIDMSTGYIDMLSWFMGAEVPAKDRKYKEDTANFSIYRVDGGIALNEMAMDRAEYIFDKKNKDRQFTGVCADAVNALYDNAIHSPIERQWDSVGHVLKSIIVDNPVRMVASQVDTPTRLSQSENVEPICEVQAGRLIHPRSVSTEGLLKTNQIARNSNNRKITRHANAVRKELIKSKVISEKDEILIPTLYFTDEVMESSE